MHQIGSGQDQALRSFAAEILPKIREHLQMAQNIALATTPQVPQATTAPASPTAPPATTPAIGPSAAPQPPRPRNRVAAANASVGTERAHSRCGAERPFTQSGLFMS